MGKRRGDGEAERRWGRGEQSEKRVDERRGKKERRTVEKISEGGGRGRGE